MLENKNFWDQFLEGDLKSSNEEEETAIDATLNPECRAGDKPTTHDPLIERSLDIDALLAEIHEKAVAKVRAALDAPATLSTVHSTGNSSEPSASSSEDSSEEILPDDDQAMREMTEAMRELTAELRQFRVQMGRSVDADHPQGIPAIPEKMAHQGETPKGAIDPSFSGVAVDGHKPSEESKAETSTKDVVKKKKTNKAMNIISNVLFYVVIVAMVLGAFLLRSTSKGQPFMIGGISAAHVLTSSMEDVYPRGSLIITRTVDPSELKIGDDITFMVSEDTSITHRIIKVSKDPVAGDYMFTTKGINNQKADEDPVSQANVVGKVIFSSKALGDIANFVKTNWPILIFVLIIIVGLITFLKWNAKKNYGEEDEGEKKEEKSRAKKEKPTSHTKKR